MVVLRISAAVKGRGDRSLRPGRQLGAAGQGVELRLKAHRPAERDIEDVAVVRVGLPAGPYVDRRHPEPLRVAFRIEFYVLFNPFSHFLAGGQRQAGANLGKIGLEGFEFHPRAITKRIELAVNVGVGIFQHVGRHIAEVFGRKRGQQETGIRVVMGGQEGIDDFVIALRPHFPEEVFLAQPFCILRHFLVGSAGRQRILCRRDDRQIEGIPPAHLMVERHRNGIAVDDSQTEAVAFRSPGHHVAAAHIKRSPALCVRLIGGHRIVFAVVVYLEFNPGVFHRLSAFVHYRHNAATGRYIAADDIDFSIAGRPLDDVLIAVIVAEDLRMQDERPRYRSGEPGHIEPGLRLACSHKMPLSVDPDLNPGVVVVGVGPARRIDLPGGNAGGAQRRHGQHRFFAAASHAALNRLQRRRRPAI